MLQRFNDIGMVRHVTSANSAMPYRDELFGPDFANSVFISEPVHNLVHCEILEAEGVSFTSHRADEKETEFLASTDNWFRPTMIKTGPDGALYLADMYRLVIEHPEWIPEDVKHRLDLRAGHDKGRIYRVYPANAELRKIPRLDQLNTAGLVAALDSPNGWQRDTAQRLLIERADKIAVKSLENLIRSSERPKTRLQALCTLDRLGAVTPEILTTVLNDNHPAVREHALRISEPLLAVADSTSSTKQGQGSPPSPPLEERAGERRPPHSQLQNTLLMLVDDPSIRVRYQLAFTLGDWSDPRAAQALVKLAAANAESPEMQIAVLSSAPRHIGGMLQVIFEQSAAEGPPAKLLDKLLGLATATGNERALASALAMVEQPHANGYAPWQFAVLGGMLDALGREGKSLEQWQAGTGPELRAAIQRLDGMFTQARAIAASSSAAVDNETALISAVRLLARSETHIKGDLELLAALLQPHFPVTIQTAALDALRRTHQPQVGEVFVQNWNRAGPTLRPKLLDALLSRPEWIVNLLAAIAQNQIPAGQLAPAEQQKLLTHAQSFIRERATKLLATIDSDRQKVVQSYRGVAGLKGDGKRGAELFQINCAVCHSIAAHPQIGPDLAALADKSVETLVEAILDPNRAVETRYVNYAAVTKDDREISGIIIAESANSITLRSPSGEETVLRRDLKQLSSSGLSLMPEGFEKILSPQDLADVIAYVRQKPRN